MLCECGCGETTNVAKRTYGAAGVRKGDHYRFVKGHTSKHGVHEARWVGRQGYMLVSVPGGWEYEHRLLTQAGPEDVVHHINGDRSDNRLENLQLMSRADHQALHRMENA